MVTPRFSAACVTHRAAIGSRDDRADGSIAELDREPNQLRSAGRVRGVAVFRAGCLKKAVNRKVA
jgi:hypothetical protein